MYFRSFVTFFLLVGVGVDFILGDPYAINCEMHFFHSNLKFCQKKICYRIVLFRELVEFAEPGNPPPLHYQNKTKTQQQKKINNSLYNVIITFWPLLSIEYINCWILMSVSNIQFSSGERPLLKHRLLVAQLEENFS